MEITGFEGGGGGDLEDTNGLVENLAGVLVQDGQRSRR